MKNLNFKAIGIIIFTLTLSVSVFFGCMDSNKEYKDTSMTELTDVFSPVNYLIVVQGVKKNNKLTIPWNKAFHALRKKHEEKNVSFIHFEKDIEEVRPFLGKIHPYHTAFLLQPQYASHKNVVKISRMCRDLDNDPYFDTFWGIITGYDEDDAITLINQPSKVVIERVIDATANFDLNMFKEGIAFNEFDRGNVIFKKDKMQKIKLKRSQDNTQDFLNAARTMKPQFIVTSAHATQHNWDMGYNGPNMRMFHTKDAQLVCVDTQMTRYPYPDSEPKFYLGCGNCLIGDVDRRDCMVTSWIRSGGAAQYVGYTVLTWFGAQGWGTLAKFTSPLRGLYNANESFHFANTDIVHKLNTQYSQFAKIDLTNYDPNRLGDAVYYQIGKTNSDKETKDLLGNLYDRDVVTFIGDPANDYRICGEDIRIEESKSNRNETRITLHKIAQNTAWPETFYVPKKNQSESKSEIYVNELPDSRITIALETENFLKLNIPKNCSPAISDITIVNAGTKLTEDVYYASIKAKMDFFSGDARFEPETKDLGATLHKMRAYLSMIDQAMNGAHDDFTKRLILASVIYCPETEFKQFTAPLLIENAEYAAKAWKECPWKEKVNFQLFRDYVLPVGCISEERSAWRKLFYDTFAKEAFKFGTPGEAAQYLNKNAFKILDVTYHATKRPKACQSPAESIKAKYASCTGLSIILADALRACCIPSRFVGVALWTDRSGNHNWIEYWDDQWIYEGAAPSDPRNRDWVGDKVNKFTNAVNNTTSVMAVARKPKKGHFILAWDPTYRSIPAHNINRTYTDTQTMSITRCEKPHDVPHLAADSISITYPTPNEVGETLWLYVDNEPVRRVTYPSENLLKTEAFFGKELSYEYISGDVVRRSGIIKIPKRATDRWQKTRTK